MHNQPSIASVGDSDWRGSRFQREVSTATEEMLHAKSRSLSPVFFPVLCVDFVCSVSLLCAPVLTNHHTSRVLSPPLPSPCSPLPVPVLCSTSFRCVLMPRLTLPAMTVVAQSAMIVDSPWSKQEMLNSVLEVHGFRKPRHIPAATDHPPRFSVPYGRVLELTEHTAIRSVLADETVFFDKHRMSVTEFLLLLALLEPMIGLTRHSDIEPTHETPHLHTKLNPAEQLLLWLYWIKGTPLSALTDLFGRLHNNTLTRCVDHVTRCINTTLEHVISWPAPEDRKSLHGWVAVCDKAVAFLDGTHLPISRPNDHPAAYWSTYKSKYTQNYLVCVNPFALITYVDGPFPGRGNDRGAFNQCTLASNHTQYVSDGEVIVADGGFMGGPQLLVPFHSDTITHAASEDEKADMISFNDELSEGRVLVEDVFGWLKATCRILESRWRGSKRKQPEVFKATCCMYNYVRMLRIEYAQHVINSNDSSMVTG